ncbi:hypothetical protein [Entomobacter blattae]|uniref:Uncharacterized protein n=1 Tax=Entomobacter blattae TaxID=2762277 RepID=A0A7H1NUH9_9PROT|nr:hypothetical protein [Entomobacter blattae]QNT79439.1 hypothetical protein JGUZn3_22380 [Entomobacter blattae]
MTLYRIQLLDCAANALKEAGTLAENRVYTARSWPTTPILYPAIILQAPLDHAQSTGKTAVSFSRTVSLAIRAQVCFQLQGDGTPTPDIPLAAKSEMALHILTEQIEAVLLTHIPLMAMVEEVSSLSTEVLFDSSSAQPVAEARMRMDLLFSQTYSSGGEPVERIMTSIRESDYYQNFIKNHCPSYC